MTASAVSDNPDLPLTVAVRGDQVLILAPDGRPLTLSIAAAERTARRILDAVAIAQGRHPSPANG
ncbi:MAG TPA: hypothetical protein VG939_04050 [Caulobacteraceae bacterium]|nr:hypothetical protein [Caulobacteraceae bacterium]